jgi:hypothetical protein
MFGIAGLILGVLGVLNGLINFGMVLSGQFFYIPLESAGLIFLVSGLSTVFSGISVAKGSTAGIAGLILGSVGASLALILVTAYTF